MRLLVALCLLGGAVAPPPRREVHVTQGPLGNVDAMPPAPPAEVDADINKLEYARYLQEVVNVLESHPGFKSKLEKMDPEDIKSGDIANHLDDLPTDVRSLLDEAKRREIDRLREAIKRQMELENDPNNVKIPEHIEHGDLEKFNKEDLRKLIKETTSDLDKLDKLRKKDFKEYEMKKRAEKDHLRAKMTPEEREKDLQAEKEAEKRHNEHPKLKHPGSKDQLEEVWEEQDGMAGADFDPRTFFNLHDINGDGFLDENEVEALFVKELEKVYNETNPDDDMRERDEEMARMREHVYKEMDKNGDKLITLEEFMNETKESDFDNDEEWEGIDDSTEYTPEELKAFEDEYARQQQWGEHPYDPVTPPMAPPPGGQPVQLDGNGQPPPPQHQQFQQGQQFQQPPAQQGQVPQRGSGAGHPVPQQQFQGQVPPQMPPQGGQAPPQGQVPNQQGQGGQVPPGQVPVQQVGAGVQAPPHP